MDYCILAPVYIDKNRKNTSVCGLRPVAFALLCALAPESEFSSDSRLSEGDARRSVASAERA